MARVHNPQILLLTLIQCTMSGSVRLELLVYFSLRLTCVAVLTRYMPKAKIRKEKNLLSNPDENKETEEVCYHIILVTL